MSFFRIITLLGLVVMANASLFAQERKDPCESAKIHLTSSDGATLSLSEISKQPRCYDGKFLRVVGVYRVAMENSDLYDPTDTSKSAWVKFDPFYPAVVRCSASELKTLDRDKGGTFGFVALGILKASGRFGHMGGWKLQFEPICIERVELLSPLGFVLESQVKDRQVRILDWYKSNLRKLME